MSFYPALGVSLVIISAAYWWYRNNWGVVGKLRGPPSPSWLVGSFGEWARPYEIGDKDFKWVKEYGTTFRLKGPFGRDFLFTCDPKAMQYVFNTSGYNYPKPPETRLAVALATGKGLAWAESQQHARQRKIMNPAFSYGALKEFLPLFRETARNLVSKLKEAGASNAHIVDIHPWMARTTLDAVGAAAFDFRFKALDTPGGNELSRAYNNLFADAFYERSDAMIIIEAICAYLPEFFVDMMRNLPSTQMTRLRKYMKVAQRVAEDILEKQRKLFEAGKEGSKDVMSILIRANLSENSKNKLSDQEILAQLTTLNLAGHETTANMLTWALYELARHPDFQTKVRNEINEARDRATQRGDTELSVADLDSMKHMLALMKETLRFHPIVTALIRGAAKNDNIPLLYPTETTSGEPLNSIHIAKDQRVIIAIAAYQRLKSIWGEDADIWRPERFLEGVERYQSTALGVTSNIATFSSGLRSCIGWRFAMIEMQTILIELLESFQFSPAPGVEIRRAPAGLMTPMVKGAEKPRSELPLVLMPLS